MFRNRYDLDDYFDEALIIVGFLLVMVGQFARWEHWETLLWWVRTVGAFISLWGGLRKAIRAKPFYVVVEPPMWAQTADESFTYTIPKKKHARGSSPQTRVTSESGNGAWVECWVDAQIVDKGNVTVTVNTPLRLRIEVRK